MIRIRYMLVDHPESADGNLCTEGKAFKNVPPMHDLCPVHHWVRLDAATVFAKASYAAHHHDTLMTMQGVTVLHPTFSRKTVVQAIQEQGNPHHKKVMLSMHPSFDDRTVTADLVDHIAAIHGSAFDHEV